MHDGLYCVVHVVGNKEVGRSQALPFVKAWNIAQKLNKQSKEREWESTNYHDVERAALVKELPEVQIV